MRINAVTGAAAPFRQGKRAFRIVCGFYRLTQCRERAIRYVGRAARNEA